MNIQVRYHSRGGNTKKLADAIAKAVGTNALTTENPVDEADILFIGGALYAGKVDKPLEALLNGLSAGSVKQVALFGNSASGKGIGEIAKPILEQKQIPVAGDYSCKGKFLLANRGKPDSKDLAAVAEFAKGIAGS